MARTRKSATPTVQVPTVTDEQYKGLLSVRLAAMHGFAEGTVDLETKNRARSAVRNARKVRKAEGAVVETYRQHLVQQAEARSQAAQKAAATRRSRKTQPAQDVPSEPVTEAA